ncbi:hypothetical protein MACK_004078 [Theileria orientalis]|uniref:ABC transporter domain-containing protein n=1 Tax=Theileria orientalis TaxID=68886 RepID=A0A976XJR1_THEOR|nr:hypothetical protein MACK_004078 [Theileria orientalis]
MSGGSIYRSFNRNSDLLGDFLEHREYSARSKFLFVAAGSWSTIMFTWVFSLTTFIILVISIILDKYTKHKMTPGYFGLALSLCMNVVKSFSNFALMYSCAQMLMGSIERFQYFIPPGKRLKFDKCPNTHEEYIVNTVNRNLTNLDKKQLLRRRAIEFKTENKKLYGLRRMFYHPRITIIDVDDYLNTEHIGVQLNDVCVYTTLEQNPETMILKHLKGSACKSEIIGMVGKTGAGKTTIFSVLQNIVENRTGQVLLDGKELNDIPKVVLRQIIGVIPQLPFVFKGWTVRRFLDPRKLFTDDDIKYALNQCGLLNFVNTLHGSTGLDTVIIPEDHVLDSKSSKGQSNNSKMNKNTSTELNKPSSDSIDQPPNQEISDRSYKEEELGFPINDLLQKYFSHCTTFVTAHDVNTLKKCTSVWVIHDGFLMKTYKASDIPENVSIASIIEESVK